MKTAGQIRAEIEEQFLILRTQQIRSYAYKKAQERVDFLNQCILLLQSGLTQESIDSQVNKLSQQFSDMRGRHRDWFKKNMQSNKNPEDNKKWNTKKFYAKTGAGKVKQQLKTYLYLQ